METSEQRREQLDKAVQAVIERVRKMTKDDHVAVFKKIGVITEDGKLAPEYSGLNELVAK